MNFLLLALFLVSIGLTLVVRKKTFVSNGFDQYTIRKGKHYSRQNGKPWFLKFGIAAKVMRFKVIFNEYPKFDNNDGDINKLYGVAFGLDNHYRSVRIGWRYAESIRLIELFAYSYINGIRVIQPLLNDKGKPLFIYGNDTYICNIVPQPNSNTVYVAVNDTNGRSLGRCIVRNIRHDGWFRIKQYPFYGGNLAAPENVTIFIEDIS